MSTHYIQFFLETVPDGRLAMLRAHCEDGKLSYWSCSCLIGTVTADHALLGVDRYCAPRWETSQHLTDAREMPFAKEAEDEFRCLGGNDEERRRNLRPLLIAEQEHRDSQRTVETFEAVPA